MALITLVMSLIKWLKPFFSHSIFPRALIFLPGSDEWNSLDENLKKSLLSPDQDGGELSKKDGEFWMSLEDFVK